jgi:phosphoribosylaminoimidazolecarboxamide formyltransferase/IMP cyclohydrolase
MTIKRALISVSDKIGLEEFAKELQKLGVEIISTGGTARYLRERGIEVKEVAEITKFPEILNGRVKTLHPLIHAAILAKRNDPSHMQVLRQLGVEPIDLLVVNLYPFEETISRGAQLEEALEQIDIGGPTLLRAAAKNFKSVAVVTNPSEYREVLKELKEKGDLSEETRLRLAKEVFELTSHYDAAIAGYFEKLCGEGGFPRILSIYAEKLQELRYGENPHQAAALYRFGYGLAEGRKLQGKELSFNNLVDLDAAWSLVQEFEEPTAAVIKHTNPCGVASAESICEAYRLARDCDPLSAYGGIVGLNRKMDVKTAEEITSTFIEAVVAPAYEPEALQVLARKPNLRALEVPAEARELDFEIKQISGGILVQQKDRELLAERKVVTRRAPTEEEWRDLLFAWKVVKHVKSNAIVLAKNKQTVGIGAGQMSRVDSTEIAIRKAGERAKGSVLASDAFFPFPDAVEKAAEAGVTAIIQPGGSIRDKQVIETADRFGLAMVFTGTRHFRH